MPGISVIIPVYNVEEDLPRCLDSVLGQTCRDLEVLLVDDGSNDGSGRICDDYAALDPRVRVLHKPNGGVGSARNAGLREASGSYISFVDADDWLEPSMLEELSLRAQAASADVTICGAWFHLPDREPQNRINGRDQTVTDARTALQEYFGQDHFGRGLWNKLFRAELLREVRFDEDIYYYEDSLFLTRALLPLLKGPGSGKRSIYFFEKPLYHYMIGRAGSSIRSFPRYGTGVTAAERIRDLFQKAGEPELADLAEYKVSFMAVNTCRQALLAGRKQEAAQYRRLAASSLGKVLWDGKVCLSDKLATALALVSPVRGVDLWLKLRR